MARATGASISSGSVTFDTAQNMKRFWSKVNKTPGCWEWTAALDRCGYGLFYVKGKPKMAHRLAYLWANGELSSVICHKCDNRRCVRPDHLFAGSQADNIADRDTKLRQARGERQGLAVLTETQVRDILASTDSGSVLAKRYGISRSNVFAIKQRRSWKHVVIDNAESH